jgi:hypothetical protein
MGAGVRAEVAATRLGDAARRAIGWLCLGASAAAVAVVQPRVAASFQALKTTSDVYALPPDSALPAISLGYRSALADLLFTSTLVSYGIHGEEHRPFEFVGEYLDAIAALDPQLCAMYRYADTFIVYRPVGKPSPEEVRHARKLLEKGLENCPGDGMLWLSTGQFLAFIGTQFLSDEHEKEEFRSAGARALSRAAEIVTDNQNIQWQALAAAGIFTREGNRQAAIAFLERVYSVTDDEELRENILGKLAVLREEGRLELARKHESAVNSAWHTDLPFVTRTRFLVLGPSWDVAGCAGQSDGGIGCAKSWAEWGNALR